MKNYLNNKLIYLSGAIQWGDSIDWRPPVKNVLTNRFGLNVFDPAADEKQKLSCNLAQAKEARDFPTMVKIAKGFLRKDLSMVDRCDFLIAFLPKGVRTCGTYHEIITSNNCKKPTLLVSDGNKAEISLWLYGFIPPEFMFDTWSDLYEYLNDVNNDKHIDNNRWQFICDLL